MLQAHLDGNSASEKKHIHTYLVFPIYIFLIHHNNTFLNTLLSFFFILRLMRIGSLHSVFCLLNHAEK